MRSPKNHLILLLAVTTIGGAVLAWRQSAELTELRAGNLKRDERADLQKRLWELEKLNRELQDQLAASRDPKAESERMAGAPDGGRREGREGGRGRGDPRGFNPMQQATALRELMSKPEVQAMVELQQKAGIEARYAALFKNLNLAPDQIEKLKNLLAERATTMQDVMSVAREQGINPRENREAFDRLVSDAQNQINSSIKSTIGDAGFAQLTNYEQTLPQRGVVNDLQQRLSYTSTPLTSEQAEQLVGILSANPAPRPQRQPNFNEAPPVQPPPGPPGGGRGPGFDFGGMISAIAPAMTTALGVTPDARAGSTPVTNAALAQSQTVLSAPQVSALQQIQQQQQTQDQLRRLIGDTMSANMPGPPPNGGGQGGPPPRKR